MATSIDVARFIVKWFQEHGDLVTNLKVQKLLYYVQGWHLGITKRRAFDGEFMAWIHGPVNYPVYQEFREFRWNPISRDMGEIVLDPEIEQHVRDVLSVYGDETAWELERRTHSESPWIKARGNLPADAECRTVIADDDMIEYFGGLISDVENKEAASA